MAEWLRNTALTNTSGFHQGDPWVLPWNSHQLIAEPFFSFWQVWCLAQRYLSSALKGS